MTEAILLILWIGTTIFLVFKIDKDKKERELHQRWIVESRACLRSVECEFRRRCRETTETYFPEYSKNLYHLPHMNDTVRDFKIRSMFDNVHKYRDEIHELKQEYLNEAYTKVAERLERHGINALPEQVVEEYERNIADIADRFTDFGSLMRSQISEIRDDYISYTDIYGSDK